MQWYLRSVFSIKLTHSPELWVSSQAEKMITTLWTFGTYIRKWRIISLKMTQSKKMHHLMKFLSFSKANIVVIIVSAWNRSQCDNYEPQWWVENSMHYEPEWKFWLGFWLGGYIHDFCIPLDFLGIKDLKKNKKAKKIFKGRSQGHSYVYWNFIFFCLMWTILT